MRRWDFGLFFMANANIADGRKIGYGKINAMFQPKEQEGLVEFVSQKSR